MLTSIHHVAIICRDYPTSKHFYHQLLGLPIIAEHYRAERQSYKLDLQLPDGSQLELFSFPAAPARLSQPEAQGLRHLCFAVSDVAAAVQWLAGMGIVTDQIRIYPYTGAQFTFFADPDGLPLELYQREASPSGKQV